MKKVFIVFLILGASIIAHADIVVGPWSFHDNAFADEALQIDEGTIYLWNATDLQDALTGYSPDRCIVNIGYDTNANLFQLNFTDLLCQNAPGDDLVLFEGRFSADPYKIAVRPVGGDFTPYIEYVYTDFIDTGLYDVAEIWGLAIDLDDFGLAQGTIIDAFRFSALPNSGGYAEGDPVMAAALNVIPEPATIALLGLGGLVISTRKRISRSRL